MVYLTKTPNIQSRQKEERFCEVCSCSEAVSSASSNPFQGSVLSHPLPWLQFHFCNGDLFHGPSISRLPHIFSKVQLLLSFLVVPTIVIRLFPIIKSEQNKVILLCLKNVYIFNCCPHLHLLNQITTNRILKEKAFYKFTIFERTSGPYIWNTGYIRQLT